MTESLPQKQIDCFITHTNEVTHKIIRDNFSKCALFSGLIKGVGPRYCPSIEDKLVKFADRTSHQIFLEPEGYDTNVVYPNGISTSLPADVQDAFIHTIKGLENVDKVIKIDQDPIGRTPRSNPATYVKLFDDIRDLFAETVEAKARGFDKGRFSFNTPGGRCETCQGAGVTCIPMNFLPDVYVRCDSCGGKRYNEETLQITYKGKTIYDILEMTVEDALTFFENRPKLKKRIQVLYDVGLGYIKLGQPATTLSGGEAQRVKLAYELQRKPTGKSLYILDEPTTGLHSDDVSRLLKILQRIVDNGDTVLVIEHNLDVIKVADYIIDLGPDGGDQGGTVVATGTPEEVSENQKSYTGNFLVDMLKKGKYC